MPSPLKEQKESETPLYQEHIVPKFQEFPKNAHTNSNNKKELFFFMRVAFFGVSTVMISFFLLVLNLAPIWSFLLAFGISLAILSIGNYVMTFLK